MMMTNQIHVAKVSIEEKDHLWEMLQAYLKELSAYGSFDISYPSFPLYWQKQDRWPYFIKSNDDIIGFSFVTKRSPHGNKTGFFLAEFYIDPAHRRSGFGREAVHKILGMYSGQWELSFFNKHTDAAHFWPMALQAYPIEISHLENVTILRFSTTNN